MIYEYANNTLNELIKEAEQSEQQKRTVYDEMNEYVVQDIPEVGKYFVNLIKNIVEDKGAKKKSKQHIVDFVNAIENDFSPETQEAFDSVLVDVKRLLRVL